MHRAILENDSRRSAFRLHLQKNGAQTLKELEVASQVEFQNDEDKSYIHFLRLPGGSDGVNSEWLKSIEDVQESSPHVFIYTKAQPFKREEITEEDFAEKQVPKQIKENIEYSKMNKKVTFKEHVEEVGTETRDEDNPITDILYHLRDYEIHIVTSTTMTSDKYNDKHHGSAEVTAKHSKSRLLKSLFRILSPRNKNEKILKTSM